MHSRRAPERIDRGRGALVFLEFADRGVAAITLGQLGHADAIGRIRDMFAM